MNTKKLKQLVLDLAIHGKLVPQDPNDEPASVLLERIKSEKSKTSKGKKTTNSSDNLDDIPFEVPDGWVWCKVTDVLSKITDGTHHSPTNLPQGEYMYITAKNIKPYGVDLTDVTYVDKTTHDEIYARCNPELGDILYIKDGATTGIACINNIKEPFSLLSSVALLKPCKSIETVFLLRYLQSSYCYSSVRETMKGVGITRITLKLIGEWSIPLPPLSEQKRIVAEIEKWFAVIDELEENATDLKKSVEQAKRKVLDLAIHGKLVEQDPNDEPANVLLERIKAEKSKTQKGKKSSIPSDNLDEVPFVVPKGWCWTRLGKINEYKSGNVNPLNNKDTEYELYSVPIYSSGFPEITKGKNIGSSKQIVEKNDVLLCKINPHLNRVWVVFHFKEELQCLASSEWVVLRSRITLPEYLRYVLMSEYFRTLLNSNVSGVGGSLTRAQPSFIEKYIIPLPPLSEQKRIVRKIEEVFGELDRIVEMIG